MNKKLLAITTVTLLLSGQSAIANDSPGEILNWFAETENVVQVEQDSQYSKVSIKQDQELDSNYKPEEDIFSIHYMSDK